MTFDQLFSHQNEIREFEEGRQADISALAERRKQADADLAKIEAKLSRDTVTTEEGTHLEAELADFRRQRTNDIGMAHADGRKANTAKLDRAIKAKEDEIAAFRERKEAADAAKPILEQRLAAARERHEDEIASINEQVEQVYAMVAGQRRAHLAMVEEYAAQIRQSALSAEMTANRFRPIDSRSSYSFVKAEEAADRDAASSMSAIEVKRLGKLGLGENHTRTASMPEIALEPIAEAPACRVVGFGNADDRLNRLAGVYAADDRRIG